MAQKVVIKLKSAGPRLGPFTIKDNFGNVLDTEVSRKALKKGIAYSVVDKATVISICSTGTVKTCKHFGISAFTSFEYADTKFTDNGISCVWKHLKNPLIYNIFYGHIEPYIIEYPFAYQYNDQILQNVIDYTKVFKYVDNGLGVYEDYAKYETDDIWFNKAILYNGQQNSGILNLYPKPKNDLSSYMAYPKFNSDSKDITFTKNDNFYQYNTFWNVAKSTSVPNFVKNCDTLSIDKQINQDNMDYSIKSHAKATLRAKELKVRHILDNRSDVKLVSQFIISPSQISHK